LFFRTSLKVSQISFDLYEIYGRTDIWQRSQRKIAKTVNSHVMQ
jgi:hypothetical protein